MADASKSDDKTKPESDPTLTPWRKEPWSSMIDVGAALGWRVRWTFRWIWLLTKWIPWPLRLVGWLVAYWSLARALYKALTGEYGETPLRDFSWAARDFVMALPDRIDALIAQTPQTVWNLIRAAPGQWADILAALTLLALLIASWTVLRDLRRGTIIVEPFSMPEALVKQGHDPVAFTRRLMAAVERDAVDAYDPWGALGSGLAGETPDLELPAARLSLTRLTQILRQALLNAPALRMMLGVQPEYVIVGSVSLEGDGEDSRLTLHAALKRWPGTDISESEQSVEALITAATPDLLEIIEPSRRIAQLAKTDVEEGEAVILRVRKRLAACPWEVSKRQRLVLARLGLHLAFFQPARKEGRADRFAAWLRAESAGPLGPLAWKGRGLALGQDLDLKAALKAYARALCANPFDATGHDGRGIRLGALGMNEEALRAHDRAVQINPGGAIHQNNRGVQLYALSRIEDALMAYDRAIEIKPDLAEAHDSRGTCLAALGNLEDALKAYDRAIEIEPGFVNAHYNRGISLGKQGQNENALKAYERAIEINPNFANAHFNAVLALCDLDSSDQPEHERLARARRAVDHAETYVRLRSDDRSIVYIAKNLLTKVEAEIAAKKGS